jgi:hypothetical protein
MYLAGIGGEHNNFEDFAHFTEALINTWTFQNICVTPLPLDFDCDREVMLWHQLEAKS